MKKIAKLLVMVLVVAMMASCFAACNDKKPTHQTPPPSDDVTTTPDGNGNVTETTTPDPSTPPPPQKVDMGGYTYRAYVRSNAATGGSPMEDGNPSFYCEDFWIDTTGEEPEDALSYAVYMRNKAIENDYNVKIRQISQSINMVQELARFFQDGERFDLTIILAKSAATAATQNLLTDLKGLNTLDLTNTAYDQNSIRELSMGGKLYYISGDMNISTMDSIAPTVVNIARYEDFAEGIVETFDGDPLYSDVYNLVTAGKWTMSTMLKIAEIATTDADTTDGDLGASDQDNVGYCQYATSTLYYFYGAGGRLTQMTDEGSPEFVIQSQKNQTLFDYIYQNLNKTSRDIKYPYGWSMVRKTNFITNATTLFTDMTLWDVRKDLYVNADFAYGILPNPVYEEGDEYNALVYFYNTVHLWAIPSLANDIDKAQIMMNVMASYSDLNREGSTMDGYYTRTLYFTVSPDPNSRRVMNIIKESQVYDIAILYDWGGWVTDLEKLGERTDYSYGSMVTALPQNAIPKLEETIELFKNPGSILDD
jgi:hypothetical protein